MEFLRLLETFQVQFALSFFHSFSSKRRKGRLFGNKTNPFYHLLLNQNRQAGRTGIRTDLLVGSLKLSVLTYSVFLSKIIHQVKVTCDRFVVFMPVKLTGRFQEYQYHISKLALLKKKLVKSGNCHLTSFLVLCMYLYIIFIL